MMIRNLTIVAAASFVLTIGCFAGAAALGGRALLQHGWSIPDDWHIDVSDDDSHVRIGPDGDSGQGQDATRQIAWAGAKALQIDLPADVTYTQAAAGAGAAIKVSGPQALVDRVTVEDGHLWLKDGGDGHGGQVTINGHGVSLSDSDQRLSVEITAPAVREITLNGGGDLALRAYDQPSLALTLNGSGDVDAQGKAARLDLQVSGSGDADLSGLDTGDAEVTVAGSGSARIAPRGAAHVNVAGSGEVNVTTKPASLATNVAGSGEVHQDW